MVFMDFVVFGIYPVFNLDTKIPPPLIMIWRCDLLCMYTLDLDRVIMIRGKEEREFLLLLMSLFFEFNENYAKSRNDSPFELAEIIWSFSIQAWHCLCTGASRDMIAQTLSDLSINASMVVLYALLISSDLILTMLVGLDLWGLLFERRTCRLIGVLTSDWVLPWLY